MFIWPFANVYCKWILNMQCQAGYYKNKQDRTWNSWMVLIWQLASHTAHCRPSRCCTEGFRDVFSTDWRAVLQNTRGSESTGLFVVFCRTASNGGKEQNRELELMQNSRTPWLQLRTSYLFAQHVSDATRALRSENVRVKTRRHCRRLSAPTAHDQQEGEYLQERRKPGKETIQ